MVDAVHGGTQLSPTQQDLISSFVQRSLAAAANLTPTLTDLSQFAEPGAKSVSYPKFGDFSTINRGSGAAGDATVIASTTDTMDLDINQYVAWIVDPKDALQSRVSVQAVLAGRAASAHGRDFDAKLIAELDAIASLNLNGAVPADITRDDVLAMREHVLDNGGDLSRATLALPVGQETAMLKITEFSRMDIYGRAVIPSGFIGTVYGVTVVINRQIEAQQAYLYDSEAAGYAFQKAPSMDSQSANEYGVGAQRWAMDMCAGTTGLQLGEQGAGATQSPLCAKLKD